MGLSEKKVPINQFLVTTTPFPNQGQRLANETLINIWCCYLMYTFVYITEPRCPEFHNAGFILLKHDCWDLGDNLDLGDVIHRSRQDGLSNRFRFKVSLALYWSVAKVVNACQSDKSSSGVSIYKCTTNLLYSFQVFDTSLSADIC